MLNELNIINGNLKEQKSLRKWDSNAESLPLESGVL